MPFNNPIPDNRPPDQRPRKDSGGLATLVQAEKLMQIAILLPSAAFIGWLAGAWADKQFHQEWISLVGLAFGGVAGLVYVVRLVLSTGGDEPKKPGGPL
jgi:ATP synthase protein I